MKTPEDPRRRELEYFHRAFDAGNEAGLFDTLVYCKKEKVPLPEWALDAAIVRQREFISGETKRHARWFRQFKQDMIDLRRALEVKDFRSPEEEGGVQWKNVYETVSWLLEQIGHEGSAGPEAIKKSYKRYVHTMKTNPSRYYVPRYFQK